ncbi:MAG TPA: hypothetical protein VK171_11910, partial [Fimbriimonas sp.]|nr:hypothetical protein [Fimbriimonas sp.]
VEPWILAWMVIPTACWSTAAYINITLGWSSAPEKGWIFVSYVLLFATAIVGLLSLRSYAKHAGYDRSTTRQAMVWFAFGAIPLLGILTAFFLHVRVRLDLERKGCGSYKLVPRRLLRQIVNRARQRGEM